MKRILAIALTATSLSACAAVEGVRPDIAAKPVPSRLDEIGLINKLRSAFQFLPPPGKDDLASATLGCYDGAELNAFRAKSAEGYARGVPEEHSSATAGLCVYYRPLPADLAMRSGILSDYVSAGFTLTDLYCSRFFTVVTASEQNRRFGHAFAGGVDTLISSILTLSNAGKAAIGIANSGFGLIDTTVEAYDSAYLVAPDMANVRKLVLAAQNEYRGNVLEREKGLPETYATARSVIERYAGLCTFPGMRQLVNDSIAEKTRKTEENKPQPGQPGKAPVVAAPPPGPPRPAAGEEPPAVQVPPG